jgi:transformation/transcription domain-associated protein
MLIEFRGSLDALTAHPDKYEAFLEHCFRPLLLVLRHTNIHYVQDEKTQEEFKFRQTLLETIHRLPNTEKMRGFVVELLQYIMNVLKAENETNAIVCLRIIIELHKNCRNYKPPLSLDSWVSPFLDFVLSLYKDLAETVKLTFQPTGPIYPSIY